MNLMIRTLAMVGALSMLVGCQAPIAGTWTMMPDQKPAKVSIGVITLANDGTYTASAKYGDKQEVVTGCYKFENGKLMLYSKDGCREYNAKIDGNVLTVMHNDATVKMQRMTKDECCSGKCKDGKECGSCSTGDKCCMDEKSKSCDAKPADAKPADKAHDHGDKPNDTKDKKRAM